MRAVSRVLLAAAAVTASAAAEDVNRIVLRVNDEIATQAEYTQRRDARIEAISRAPELSVEDKRRLVAESGRAAMREIFDELLMLARAEQLRVEVSPAAVDRGVEAAKRRFGIESDEEFRFALEQSAMTLEQFRENVARNVAISEVIGREVNPKIEVEDEEIARYWREHGSEFGIPASRRVEEAVVVNGAATDAAAAGALAERIREAVAAGKGVAAAVEELGAGDRALVLDHEWVERGTLDPALDGPVWDAAPGAVLGPIAARGGLHVLRMVEAREAKVRPLEEVRAEVRNALRNREYDRLSRELVEQLAANALVVEHLPEEAAGYRAALSGDSDPVRALMRDAVRRGDGAPATESAPPAAEAPPAGEAPPA